MEFSIINSNINKNMDIREKMKDLAQKQIIKFNKSFKKDNKLEKLKKHKEIQKIITGSVIKNKSQSKEQI